MMQRRSFLKLIAATAGLPFRYSHADAKDATISGNIPVLILEGPPRNRGHIHGESLRTQIQGILAAWRDMLHAATGIEPNLIVQDIIANTGFKKSILRFTPEYWEELEGIAEGADVPLDDLFVLNLPDEHRWYLQAKQAGIALAPIEQCTTLGFAPTDNTPTLMGQNMDIPSASEGFEVLFDIRDDKSGIRSMVFSIAGLIGVIGMNNQPLGIGNNSLKQLAVSVNGLPVNFILRGLLNKTNAEEAITFLHDIPHATGHNWMIGDKNEVRTFECSAMDIQEFVPMDLTGIIYHTNHPFVSEVSSTYLALHKDTPPQHGSSEARFEVLLRLIYAHTGKAPSIEFIKSVLSNQDNTSLPISRPHNPTDPDATYTAASLIMELSNSPRLHLAPGPPHQTTYTMYSL